MSLELHFSDILGRIKMQIENRAYSEGVAAGAAAGASAAFAYPSSHSMLMRSRSASLLTRS
jgi:hypothetical protein